MRTDTLWIIPDTLLKIKKYGEKIKKNMGEKNIEWKSDEERI